MRWMIAGLLLPFCCVWPLAAAGLPEPQSIDLWEGGPPGAPADATPGHADDTGRIYQVGLPSLLVYTPPAPAPVGGRMAMVVCPGGGYQRLTGLVGASGAAQEFLPKNVVVAALRYRLAAPAGRVEQQARADGLRAIRLLRAKAELLGIDPQRIGMIGWSAGGNLTLNVASHSDAGDPAAADPVERESSRPDFVAMLCPWPNRPPKSIDHYPIGKNAPPAFIATAQDDRTAPVSFARDIARAYQSAGVPHQLFTPATGGHGAFSIGAAGEGGNWPQRFWPWLQEIGVR